ncbi:hypothetical protein COU61_02690 [Candidatus Pacearchaeota archaeon CG10_big_fil_rev_8_21_14_0_10_35_13]|nr:MAG: hypothetical protein COU61_02690 [Candidatus Pacearchaeota archaeon CG10_big_fil_rev_8_21_14_0_10_35_13]
MMVKIQVIKTPMINGLGHTKKTRNASNGIIAEAGRGGEWDIEEIHVDNDNLEEQEKLVYENSKEAYEKNDKVIFIGGDHSLTYVTGKAFLEYYGKESYMIVLDAHADAMKPMTNPTHEEWVRALIEEGWNTKNIIIAGIRRIEPEEEEWLKNKGIRYVMMENIKDQEIFTESIMELAGKNPLYLSIDIDVIDPAFAPGTHYQEPGGFTSKEILTMIKKINMKRSLKAVDLVEVEEGDGQTIKLAGRILEILTK